MMHNPKTQGVTRRLLMLLVLPLILVQFSLSSLNAAEPAGRCTTDPAMNIPDKMFIISSITNSMSCILHGHALNSSCPYAEGVAERMFKKITTDTSYIRTIQAVAVLFVLLYGITFMLGITQLTINDFMIRGVKLGLVSMLITSPTVWEFFARSVGVFFHDGTNWLIHFALKAAMGTIPGIDPSQPFMLIDYGIQIAFSSKMFVTVIAMMFTGPFGFIFGLLMIASLGVFVAALLQAMWIYLMSMVVRAFLFALAPIFIPFMLFEKTKHLFQGWLNQLLNSMLQPVLLFTFFSFFMTLVGTAMINILRVPVCYVKSGFLFKGGPMEHELPRFKLWDRTNNSWEFYNGEWSYNGPTDSLPPGVDTPIFPVDIMDVLIFLILVQLAWKFNGIAINIAKELSGSPTSFNLPMAGRQLFSPGHKVRDRLYNSADTASSLQAGKGQDSIDYAQAKLASTRPKVK